MHQYQKEFIEFAISHGVLKFGEFQLKSGRISPYFFNAGLFNSGRALAQLSRFYAAALILIFRPDIVTASAYSIAHFDDIEFLSVSEALNKERPVFESHILEHHLE